MNPSPASIARVRYWIVVGLRLAAAALVATAAVLGWSILQTCVRYELVERGVGGDHVPVLDVLLELVRGPVALLAGAWIAVRFGPAAARWAVPMPRTGCPECGYAATPGLERCPECGLALSTGARPI
jgi:hypothetical protein